MLLIRFKILWCGLVLDGSGGCPPSRGEIPFFDEVDVPCSYLVSLFFSSWISSSLGSRWFVLFPRFKLEKLLLGVRPLVRMSLYEVLRVTSCF